MLNDLKQEFQTFTDDKQIVSWLASYLERAETDSEIFKALRAFSDYLEKRGYVTLQIYLLETLYQIKAENKIAYKLAKSYLYLDHIIEAKEWIQCIDVKVKGPKIDYLRAQILIYNEEYRAARQKLKEIIQAYPQFYQAYVSLADLYYLDADYDQALYYYQVVMNYFYNYVEIDRIRLRMMEIHSKRERVDFEEIETLVNHPDCPIQTAREYAALAQIYLAYHQIVKAQEAAYKAIELDKDDFQAHWVLLETLHLQGQHSLAVGKIEWFIDNMSEYDERLLPVIQVARELPFYSSHLAQAAKNLYDLLSQAEDRYKVVDYCVAYYLDQDKANLALDFLQHLNDYGDDEDYFCIYYARVYRALGMEVSMIEAYERALEQLTPEETAAYEYVDYLAGQGRQQDAFMLAQRFYRTYYDILPLRNLREELRLIVVDQNYERGE